MNLLTLQGLTQQTSDRVLLDQMDMLINTGDQIGCIGSEPLLAHTFLLMADIIQSSRLKSNAPWGTGHWSG